MAHQETPEAADAPVSYDQDSAVAALRDMNIDGDEPEEEDEDSDAEPDDFDETDLDEEGEAEEDEQEDGDDEPETAIDAPASLNAEEKALFAQLPKEAQQGWAASENRRNQQVQEATTKASQAQRDAEARAAAADAEAKRVYASQLNEFVAAFEPQEPQPAWFRSQQDFDAARANYTAQKAQHDQLVQQISAVSTEASESERMAFIQQRDRELMQIPEIANEETRKGYLDKAFSMARELGYDESELAEGMSARDLKALANVAEWKEKAAKLDAVMARKMKRVRAGKQRTNKPGVAQPKGSGQRKSQQATMQRLKQSGSQEDAVAALSHLIS